MFNDILTLIIVGVNCIELTKFLTQQKKKILIEIGVQ